MPEPLPTAAVPQFFPDERAPAVEGPTWPCASCGALTPLDDAACAACGAGFLAPLHEDGPVLVLPLVGDVSRLSQAQRLGLALGIVLLVVLLTSLLAALLA